jgi:hypothetical protein
MASSPFCDFLILGAGVTPAQGGAEPTVGSALNKVIYPPPYDATAVTFCPSLIVAAGTTITVSPPLSPCFTSTPS